METAGLGSNTAAKAHQDRKLRKLLLVSRPFLKESPYSRKSKDNDFKNKAVLELEHIQPHYKLCTAAFSLGQR